MLRPEVMRPGGSPTRLHWWLVLAAALFLAGPRVGAAAGLAAAAEVGDRDAVLAGIAAGEDVNQPLADGTSALLWAVYHEDLELVRALLGAGADVDRINDYGASALGEAAVAGNPEVIAALLAAGASVDLPGTDGQTPLMVVARGGNVAAARHLLEAGADVNAREAWRNQTALIWAAAQAQPGMVRLLLDYGADPNAQSAANDWQRQVSAERRRLYRVFGGMTALMYAARTGCMDCARALVSGGADPDLSDTRGVTPLLVALDNFHFDTARYLVEAGASLNSWDWWGRTPLYMAVDMNTLPRGGRPDRRSTDATTSLELIQMMLERGANPNAQLKLLPPYRARGPDRGCDAMLTTGATPLLRAAKTFDLAAMRALIEHGARLDLPNDSGIRPIMAAAGYGSLECDIRGYGPGIPHYLTDDVEAQSIAALEILLAAGADINAVTTAQRITGGRGGGGGGRGPGQTPLFGAAFWGWNDVVSYLVDQGARIDSVDAVGRTAVDAAMGRAGGHERGASIQVFEATAELLRSLCTAEPGCRLDEAAASL